MALAVNIREERINRGLSLRDAAAAMNLTSLRGKVDESILRNAEKGNSVPLPRNAKKIADFYGYRVTDIWPEREIYE